MATRATATLGALAMLMLGPPALAAPSANRAWVSGHGVDQAGCGAPTAPCRSLQYAHDNAVAAGGEIDILDPAGYGAITITKDISIVNDGVGTAGVQATSGSAITIDAGGGDTVYLKGLNIDGLYFSGDVGVMFNSGKALTITGCVIRHFQNGILLEPTAGLLSTILITDTVSSTNTSNGLYVDPPSGGALIHGQIERLTASGNFNDGVLINEFLSAGSIDLAFADLDASENVNSGFSVDANDVANAVVSLDNAQLNLNGHEGLVVANLAVAHLSRSVINQNGDYGVENETTGAGAVYSLGNNEARGNLSGNILGTVSTQPLF